MTIVLYFQCTFFFYKIEKFYIETKSWTKNMTLQCCSRSTPVLGSLPSSASLYDCYPPLSLIQWDQVHYMSLLLPPATMMHTHCTTLDLYFHSSIFCILLIGQTKAFLQRYNKSLIIEYINTNDYNNNNNNDNAVPKPCYELYHKVSINPF